MCDGKESCFMSHTSVLHVKTIEDSLSKGSLIRGVGNPG